MKALRKLERQVVKSTLQNEKKNVKKNFSTAWKEFREKSYVTKDADGNIVSDKTPKNTMKKKQVHFDNVEQYSKMLAYCDALRKQSNEEPVKA